MLQADVRLRPQARRPRGDVKQTRGKGGTARDLSEHSRPSGTSRPLGLFQDRVVSVLAHPRIFQGFFSWVFGGEVCFINLCRVWAACLLFFGMPH